MSIFRDYSSCYISDTRRHMPHSRYLQVWSFLNSIASSRVPFKSIPTQPVYPAPTIRYLELAVENLFQYASSKNGFALIVLPANPLLDLASYAVTVDDSQTSSTVFA